MSVSEDMILGSVSNGQAFGALKDPQGNTCAMGAVMEVRGLSVDMTSYDKLYKIYPYLKSKAMMPDGLVNPYSGVIHVGEFENTLVSHIVCLNNQYRWPRPKIAAWVAEKERELGIVDGSTKEEQVSSVEEGVTCR